MEQIQQPIQTNQPTPPIQRPNNSFAIVLFAFLIIAIIGGGLYLVLSPKTKTAPQPTSTNQPKATPTLTPTPTPQSIDDELNSLDADIVETDFQDIQADLDQL